jgi:hypothetical protein
VPLKADYSLLRPNLNTILFWQGTPCPYSNGWQSLGSWPGSLGLMFNVLLSWSSSGSSCPPFLACSWPSGRRCTWHWSWFCAWLLLSSSRPMKPPLSTKRSTLLQVGKTHLELPPLVGSVGLSIWVCGCALSAVVAFSGFIPDVTLWGWLCQQLDGSRLLEFDLLYISCKAWIFPCPPLAY